MGSAIGMAVAASLAAILAFRFYEAGSGFCLPFFCTPEQVAVVAGIIASPIGAWLGVSLGAGFWLRIRGHRGVLRTMLWLAAIWPVAFAAWVVTPLILLASTGFVPIAQAIITGLIMAGIPGVPMVGALVARLVANRRSGPPRIPIPSRRDRDAAVVAQPKMLTEGGGEAELSAWMSDLKHPTGRTS